jgi:hypothetical protein
MKIRTQISITVEKADGTVVVLERAQESTGGDNPRFDRIEVVKALENANEEFLRANHLKMSADSGADPL